MKPLIEQQKIDIYGDPVHERHVYLLKQKKTADDDDFRHDWIEQCFTFPPTQYRLYGRRFLQVKISGMI